MLFQAHLNMGPRDVDALTLAEFDRFCEYADAINQRGVGVG